MFDAGAMLAAIAGALVVMTIAAARVPAVARVFLVVQIAYWGISYLARPIVLLWVQPTPGFGDGMADPRLADIGYDHGIAMVLRPVAVGLWVYAALVVGYAVWSRGRPATGRPAGTDPNLVPTLATVLVIGMLGRLGALATGNAGAAGDVESSSPILSGVATLATVSILGLIVYFRSPDRWLTAVVIGGLLLVQLQWTVAIQSKSPIMGAALALAVRFAWHGWTRRRIVGVVAISLLAVGGFGWLQSLKLSRGAQAVASVADAQYPPAVQPFMSILRRFDLLEAATDAYYMAGQTWIAPGEAVRYTVESLVPAQLLGSDKFHAGTAWAEQVRGSSVDMTRVSVSLAEGNINEGFVLGGFLGVVVGVVFTFCLLLTACWALRARHVVPVTLGLTLIGAPVLFERGILGSAEVVGKTLQIAVAIWIVDMVVRDLRRGRAGASAAPRRRDVVVPVGTATGDGQ